MAAGGPRTPRWLPLLRSPSRWCQPQGLHLGSARLRWPPQHSHHFPRGFNRGHNSSHRHCVRPVRRTYQCSRTCSCPNRSRRRTVCASSRFCSRSRSRSRSRPRAQPRPQGRRHPARDAGCGPRTSTACSCASPTDCKRKSWRAWARNRCQHVARRFHGHADASLPRVLARPRSRRLRRWRARRHASAFPHYPSQLGTVSHSRCAPARAAASRAATARAATARTPHVCKRRRLQIAWLHRCW